MYTDYVTPIIYIVQEAINSHQEMRVTSNVDKERQRVWGYYAPMYIGHKKRESEKESKRHRSTKTLKDINVGDSIEQPAKILTTPLVVRQPCQDPKKTNSKKKK